MKTIPVLLCLCLGALSMAAEAREIRLGSQWPELTAVNGKVFRNVKFTFVSPREVRFMHSNGIGSLRLNEVAMSEEVTVFASPASTALGPLGAMMSPEERKLSGVDKLNNHEQAKLAAWLKKTIDNSVQEQRETSPSQKVAAGASPAEAIRPSAHITVPAQAPAAPEAITLAALRPSIPPEVEPGPDVVETALGAPTVLPALDPEPFVNSSSPALLPPADPTSVVSLARGGKSRRLVIGGTGVVESRIDGEFSGLGVGKKFRLQNGQVWVQEEAYGQNQFAYSPGMMIYPADGGWVMKVDGVDKAVRVTPFP